MNCTKTNFPANSLDNLLHNSMTSKNILIADDDPSIVMIVSHVVRRFSAVSVSARDGKEAFALLQQQAFDLLITDETMPHITGLELAWWLRSQEKLSHIPVIMLSAEQNPTVFHKALADKTIDSFLPKPFNPKALSELLELFLKK